MTLFMIIAKTNRGDYNYLRFEHNNTALRISKHIKETFENTPCGKNKCTNNSNR